MKINILDNGWTVELTDINLAKATNEELYEIAKLVATNTLVFARNQKFTPDDEVRITKTIGLIEDFNPHAGLPPEDGPGISPHRRTVPPESRLADRILPDSNNKILRVTGELNENNVPGLFGHKSTLDWHANRPWDPNRLPVVWLYAERGSVGSVTSFANGVLAYQDMDQEFKNFIKDKTTINGHIFNSYTEENYGWGRTTINYNYKAPVVYTNKLGVTGLNFSYYHIHHFTDMAIKDSEDLKNRIHEWYTQPKYIYDHHWQDGDVLLADQYLGIHKRWAFENMEQRVLHRITTSYDNCPWMKQ